MSSTPVYAGMEVPCRVPWIALAPTMGANPWASELPAGNTNVAIRAVFSRFTVVLQGE